jgi:OmpA-OmpF porin, OOP family
MRSSRILDHGRRLSALLFCTGCLLSVTGQNLVLDPGFEEPRSCPTGWTAHGKPILFKRWDLPTAGTADCFNRCSPATVLDRSVGIPNNFGGYQQPHGGDGYAGIGVEPPGYAEYLQSRLRAPLKAKHRYHVEFWASRADVSLVAMPGLGAYLSKHSTHMADYGALSVVPQFRCDSTITDTTSWLKLSAEFTAEGGEQYLVIGCFPMGLTLPELKRHKKKDAYELTGYYYLDDVQVTPLIPEAEPTAMMDSAVAPTPTIFILQDVLFDHDRFDLKPAAQHFLDSLVNAKCLGDHGVIRVNGHTDNTGGEPHNLELSLHRAETVAAYFKRKGFDAARFICRGFGSSIPLDDNSSVIGRSRNRRVEITVLR